MVDYLFSRLGVYFFKDAIRPVSLFIFFFVASCSSDNKDDKNFLILRYSLSDYEYVLSSTKSYSNIFKGYLYEYGLVSGSYSKAIEFYNELPDKQREYRIFMYCILHCEKGQIEESYTKIVDKNKTASVLYSIYLSVEGEDCKKFTVNDKSCFLGSSLVGEYGSDKAYVSAAKSFIDKYNNNDINELSYYLLRLALKNGQRNSKELIATMHYQLRWVPRDCSIVRSLTIGLEDRENRFQKCFK